MTLFLPFVDIRPHWSIGLYSSEDGVRFRPHPSVRNPVLTAAVLGKNFELVADPFLFRRGNEWVLFFEALDAVTGRGEIAAAKSADGLSWSKAETVLKEPFHLSYPFVFEWEGKTYMVPETGGTGTVRLYEAQAFPSKWRFVKTLLEGQPFNDATLFRHDGRWWLFAGTRPYIDDTLCVYFADHPTGPWMPHAKNPVVRDDPRSARPAGRILAENGKIVRFAQEDYPYYGRAVRAFEVTRLTPDEYAEKEIAGAPFPKAPAGRWNIDGMHHIDALRTADGKWIAAVDGLRFVWHFGLRKRTGFGEFRKMAGAMLSNRFKKETK